MLSREKPDWIQDFPVGERLANVSPNIRERVRGRDCVENFYPDGEWQVGGWTSWGACDHEGNLVEGIQVEVDEFGYKGFTMDPSGVFTC